MPSWQNIGPIDFRSLMSAEDIQREDPPAQPSAGNGDHSDPEYQEWLSSNVEAQRQDGYHVVYIKTVRGDLDPEQFRGLADIVRKYTGGKARTTQEQNLVLRWVPTGHLHNVWSALQPLELAEAGHSHISNVVSLPRHGQLQTGDHVVDGTGPKRCGPRWRTGMVCPRTRVWAISASR